MYKILEKLFKNQKDYPVLSSFFDCSCYNRLKSMDKYKLLIDCEEIGNKKFIEEHENLDKMQKKCFEYFIENEDLRKIDFDKVDFNTHVNKIVHDRYYLSIVEEGKYYFIQIFPYFVTKENFNFLLEKFEKKLNKKLNKYSFADFLDKNYYRDGHYYNVMSGLYELYYSSPYIGHNADVFTLGLFESEDDLFNIIMMKMARFDLYHRTIFELKNEIKKLFDIDENEFVKKINNFFEYLDDTQLCESSFNDEVFDTTSQHYDVFKNDKKSKLTKEKFKEVLNAIFLGKININKCRCLSEKCMFLYLMHYEENVIPLMYLEQIVFNENRFIRSLNSNSIYEVLDRMNNSMKNIDCLKKYFSSSQIKTLLSLIMKLMSENLHLTKYQRESMSKFLEENDIEENFKQIIFSILINQTKGDIEKNSFLKCKSKNKLIYRLCQSYEFDCCDVINVLLENYGL